MMNKGAARRHGLSFLCMLVLIACGMSVSSPGLAATAANLVTICTSAHATTQASKCTAWQYNVYSAGAYIETYPQAITGPKVWTDPAYAYRLGYTIASTMGVKVCPTALIPGTSFSSAAADPCPNNKLVSAASVLPYTHNLVTICTSVDTTTQASKCTAWQYNFYSPTAFIETYPQVSPGPRIWTDPAYVYRLGSTITSGMGIKVCPTALLPGTSFTSASADPCPNNILASASTIIPSQTLVAATPSLNPGTGSFTGTASVMLSDSTPGATIYYTIDGSTPSTMSPKYTGTLTFTSTTSLKAIAVASGYAQSAVASATYSIFLAFAPTPAFGPTAGSNANAPAYYAPNGPPVVFYAPGNYGPPATVNLTDSSLYAYFYYTTDGTAPGLSSTLYTGPIPLAAGRETTISAIAYSSFANAPSAIITGYYSVPATLPSDSFPGPNAFLYNSPQSDSCDYYKKIGAIPSGISDPCATNADSSYSNGITKARWLTDVYGMVGGPESFATFVNVNDLNFVRDHHAVGNANQNPTQGASQNRSAAYVCNYPGPDFYHSPFVGLTGRVDPAAVDGAIAAAIQKVRPLPCVAIDYGVVADPNNPGSNLNGGKPFMRFLVFNPAGNLMSAVDLDGRGAKAIPNACSACHGIPVFALCSPCAQDPDSANYIPFDLGNLAFSTGQLVQENQLKPDVEAQIRALNVLILNGAKPQDATSPLYQLIHGWYDSYNSDGTVNAICCKPGSPTSPATTAGSPTQQPYTPPGISTFDLGGDLGLAANGAYDDVYAPVCRSCHVANGVPAAIPPTTPGEMLSLFINGGVCDPVAPGPVMPQSKIAFDRFWSTHVGPTRQTDPINGDFADQPYTVQNFFAKSNIANGTNYTCSLTLP